MKKIFKDGIIFFAVCILLFILRNQWTPYLMTKSTYGMPALIEKGSIQNLYIGSSMFRQGLDINIMSEKDNGEHYILAYNGNQPVLECFQLQYLLEQGVEIDRLFVDMYVYSAFKEPNLEDEKLLMEIGLSDKVKLSRLIPMKKWEEFWRMFVSSNNELILTWPVNRFIINTQFYQGGSLVRSEGSTEDKLQDSSVPRVGDALNEQQKQAIAEIVTLANDNGIELYFVETPKYIKLAQDIMYTEAMQEYVQFLNGLDVSMILHDNTCEMMDLDAIEGLIVEYPFDFQCAEYYSDLYHLSYQGRCEFTGKLLSVLQ